MLARDKIDTVHTVKRNQPALRLSLAAVFFFCTALVQAQTPVILISIDTLRADHLSAYGYARIHTPNIDSFADQGTLFTQAGCQIPLTFPSHASMLTSIYPFQNQVEENAVPLPPGAVTLASVLHSHGYKTAAFIGTVFMEKEMGLDQGFDFYESPFHYDAFSPISGSMFLGAVTPGNPNEGRDRRDGALVIRSARQWLAENKSQPLFAFVHLFDMHRPYEHGYDGQLAYVDRLIGNFKQSLIQLGLWDKALVILVSDHGESLGDHGENTHGYFIYESTLHVPLMIHWPAHDLQSPAAAHPARVTDPVGLIDVAPTILDFLHFPVPPSFEGSDLFAPGHAVYAESTHARDAFGWAPLRSLRVGQYKYIEAPKPELYNLQTDPRELTSVYVKTGSPKAADLRAQLAKLLVRYAPKKPDAARGASPAARALLDSLGYLSSGPRTAPGTSAADPKDRLPEFQLYETSQDQLMNHKMKEAMATLTQILVRDPHNLLARRDLGSSYLDAGDYQEARAAFQQVLTTVPDDYIANFKIGFAEERLGLLKEAKDHLETACRVAPESKQSRKELDTVESKLK
jgi:choline-sulfatase